MALILTPWLTEQAVDPISGLMQYGIVGAVFAVVLGLITLPLVRAMIGQNERAIDLLRQSVENNTHAVQELQSVRAEQQAANANILVRLDRLLDRS